MTTIARDCDLLDTLESAAIHMQAKTAEEGALALIEIFETPGAVSIEDASVEGMRRRDARADQEENQAILYYWSVFKWGVLTDGGTLTMDKPAPLTRDEIAVVLEQLARHPEYEGFRIISTDQTGALVVLANGKIEED